MARGTVRRCGTVIGCWRMETSRSIEPAACVPMTVLAPIALTTTAAVSPTSRTVEPPRTVPRYETRTPAPSSASGARRRWFDGGGSREEVERWLPLSLHRDTECERRSISRHSEHCHGRTDDHQTAGVPFQRRRPARTFI